MPRLTIKSRLRSGRRRLAVQHVELDQEPTAEQLAEIAIFAKKLVDPWTPAASEKEETHE